MHKSSNGKPNARRHRLACITECTMYIQTFKCRLISATSHIRYVIIFLNSQSTDTAEYYYYEQQCRETFS